MTEHLENDLIERTGLTRKQVREFRRNQLKPGDVRMEKHRWVWSEAAAARLLREFVSGEGTSGLSEKNGAAQGEQSAGTARIASLLTPPKSSERELVVFRAAAEGVLNRTVLEALPPGVKWAKPEDRIVVRVYDNSRFRHGQKIVAQLVPGNSWLHRFVRRIP